MTFPPPTDPDDVHACYLATVNARGEPHLQYRAMFRTAVQREVAGGSTWAEIAAQHRITYRELVNLCGYDDPMLRFEPDGEWFAFYGTPLDLAWSRYCARRTPERRVALTAALADCYTSGRASIAWLARHLDRDPKQIRRWIDAPPFVRERESDGRVPICFRLSPSGKAAVERLAASRGATVSATYRALIADGLRVAQGDG